ncbi:MAG: peptidylprolyl isomerase [Desulfopila sp.]|jgi:peptidyl-prolyl cis-trans isomerase SurA|nr:peptidylprolyl isomerase [Desulfopila sp.]
MIINFFHYFSSTRTILLLFSLFLFFHGNAAAQVLDRVVAIVEDDIITLSELRESSKSFLERVRQTVPEHQREEALEGAEEQVLTKLIDQRLVSQQAAKANIRISDEELEQNYANNLKRLGISSEALGEKLAEAGLSMEKYRNDLRSQLLRDKLITYEVRSKIIVTDEMIKEYYNSQYSGELADDGYYLLQIGFTWGNSEEMQQSEELLAADKARARQSAVETREQLLNGADFTTLARERSELPSASDGGDLGVFHKDEMAPYMRDAIINLKTGEITPVLETPGTFQIFKVLSRRQEGVVEKVPYEAVKEEIRNKLFEEKFATEYRNWVDSIKQNAYVKKML